MFAIGGETQNDFNLNVCLYENSLKFTLWTVTRKVADFDITLSCSFFSSVVA